MAVQSPRNPWARQESTVSRSVGDEPCSVALSPDSSVRQFQHSVSSLVREPRVISPSDYNAIISACFRRKQPSLALSLFSSYKQRQLLPPLSADTIHLLIRCCMLKKDIATIDLLFEEASPELREDALFKAECARALLSCGDYYSGIRLVKEFVNGGVLGNDVSNILLEGLSEGGFDEECVQLFKRLKLQSKEREFEKEPVRLFVHGYSAVIRSLCRLKKRESAEALFREMESKGLKPLPFVFFELCELEENRQEWRRRLEEVESQLVSRQVFLTSDEEDMMVAVLKEKNFEAARTVLEAYCREYAWREKRDPKTKAVDLDVRQFPQSVARMMTYSLFSRLGEGEWTAVNVIVGRNARAVERLLKEDLFPRIEYRRSSPLDEEEGTVSYSL